MTKPCLLGGISYSKTLFVWISNPSVLFVFSKYPVAFLYLENGSKMKGMYEKLVNMKLVSSAYCESFRFLECSLNPLMLGSLFTLFVNMSF